MKSWGFVVSNVKKAQKNNFFTEKVSIFSDRGDENGIQGALFPKRKSVP